MKEPHTTMNRQLKLTYPEDLNRPENLPAILTFLAMFVPDEQWKITRNQDCTLEAECDSLSVKLTINLTEE